MNKELKKKVNIQNDRSESDERTIEELYNDLKILRLLGQGAFGSVHECYDPSSK